MTDTNEAIVVDGLTKKYGRHRGVEDVTLTVAYGEILGFLGPNGSGKTTVLRTIMGLLQPTHGRVSVGGVPVTSDPRIWRASTGYLPGELELPPNMTVRRYLEFLTRLRRLSCDDEIDRLAQRLRLDLTARISGLSKGNRQKVGVVQALMHRPSIVLLDEPTSGLDPIAQEEFAQLLDERRQEGTAVVLSTHVLHEVEAVADRVVILDEGRVLAVDTVGTSTGRRSVGLGVAMVVLITGFVFYSLAPLVDFFASINPYNPLQWMLGARPLTSGVSIGYVALLMTLSAVGFASSDEAFRGRDIRV